MSVLIAQRYLLEEKIGSGGMGVVWRATDLELGRVVALKRSQSGDGVQIRQEARFGAGLQHPHVVTVYDAVIDEAGDRWIVMEHLRAPSLAKILAEDGVLSPESAAAIGAQVASALAAMHTNGMVHRDIKPSNVLVTADGTAKLTDLGIARWAEETFTNGAVVGTPGFLAPEVADGGAPGAAADVFSLGATLFAAIEGGSPWGDGDAPIRQLRRAASFDLAKSPNAGLLAPVLDCCSGGLRSVRQRRWQRGCCQHSSVRRYPCRPPARSTGPTESYLRTGPGSPRRQSRGSFRPLRPGSSAESAS